MDKRKITLSILFMVIIGKPGLHAQESVNAAGGEATGTAGEVSYSIGQTVYTTNTNSDGSISQGVQQTYDISVSIDENNSTNDLELLAYPNPTTDFLTLRTGTTEIANMHFHLLDINGKLIETKQLKSGEINIQMKSLAPATYFLNVTASGQIVKTFKIIKN